MRIKKEADGDTIDDLTIGYTGDSDEKIIGVHLERMDTSYYWLGVDLADGRTIHVDIYKPKDKKKKINARFRG